MNRKIIITFLLMVFTLSTFAQKRKVANAVTLQEAGDLKGAYAAIMEALNPDDPIAAEKTLNWARAWEVKGDILYDIHKMGIKNIAYEPLLESFRAYKRILELNPKKMMFVYTKDNFRKLMPELSNMAIQAYKLGRFSVALDGYNAYLEIAEMPMYKHEEPITIDTAVYYNAALAAFSDKNWDESIKYFNLAKNISKYGEDSYFYLYGVYKALNDTLNQYNNLKEAFTKYSDSENINIELVKFCIETNRPEEAVDYIDVAISKSPDNAAFYSLRGRALEDAGKDQEAIEAYLKAIQLDPDLFVPTYNLAVIYYNRGVSFINSAVQLPEDADEEYDKQIALGTEQFAKGLPLFEKAISINPDNEKVKESLQFIRNQIAKANETN